MKLHIKVYYGSSYSQEIILNEPSTHAGICLALHRKNIPLGFIDNESIEDFYDEDEIIIPRKNYVRYIIPQNLSDLLKFSSQENRYFIEMILMNNQLLDGINIDQSMKTNDIISIIYALKNNTFVTSIVLLDLNSIIISLFVHNIFKNNSNIKNLSIFGDDDLNDGDLQNIFFDELIRNNKLETINLQIDFNEKKYLTMLLENASYLKILNLGNMSFDDEDINYLIEGINNCPTLNNLYFNPSFISDLQKFTESLYSNITLEILALSFGINFNEDYAK